MRAVRWHARGDVRLDIVPRPVPQTGEVVVAVELCGLCGSDFGEVSDGPLEIPTGTHHQLTGRQAPLTLGHEVIGHVVERGPDTAGPAIGTRVVPDVVLGCGRCWWCRRHQEGLCEIHAVRGLHTDGGLAEFMLADAATLVVLDPELPPAIAVLAEPMSVAVRAVRKAGDLTGGTVAVWGVGSVGLLITHLALRSGARVICVDVDTGQLARAGRAGATTTMPDTAASLVASLTEGRGADVVFECSGASSAVAQAVTVTRPGGKIVLIGITAGQVVIPHADLVIGEKQLLGTAAHLWDEDMTTAVRLLERGVITAADVPVRVVDLSDAVAALSHPDRSVLKTAVSPT